MRAQKISALLVAFTCMLLAPIRLGTVSMKGIAYVAFARINVACGQASACEPRAGYICSRSDGDEIGSVCSAGCEPPIAPG
jgi:hypothetical protein